MFNPERTSTTKTVYLTLFRGELFKQSNDSSISTALLLYEACIKENKCGPGDKGYSRLSGLLKPFKICI